MASAADFDEALREQGLPAAYRFEAEVHQAQQAQPGSIQALDAFHLLPADKEPSTADGTRLFPPEYGETAEEYWIWYVRCPAFFPGPFWLLQRGDGQEPPYAYGYQ